MKSAEEHVRDVIGKLDLDIDSQDREFLALLELTAARDAEHAQERERLVAEAILKEHANHVQFLNDLHSTMYATLVDPVPDGPINEQKLKDDLIEAARRCMQSFLREQALNARIAELEKENAQKP